MITTSNKQAPADTKVLSLDSCVDSLEKRKAFPVTPWGKSELAEMTPIMDGKHLVYIGGFLALVPYPVYA
jgi:hypothetical protein